LSDTTRNTQQWLMKSANMPYAYLTTFGRSTGRPHRIEIWFAVDNGRLYLMSGGRDRSDWVRNILVNPQVTTELGEETHPGIARLLEPDTVEDRLARKLLVAKYRQGNNLDEWGRNSLPVVIDFPADDSDAPPL